MFLPQPNEPFEHAIMIAFNHSPGPSGRLALYQQVQYRGRGRTTIHHIAKKDDFGVHAAIGLDPGKRLFKEVDPTMDITDSVYAARQVAPFGI